MNDKLLRILQLVEQSAYFGEEEKKAVVKAVNATDKQLSATEFELARTEQVNHTTSILLAETIGKLEQKRKTVEAQSRELEIEAALEKIRSSSLAMHHSGEIKNVVAVLFGKLKELGLVFDGGAAIVLFTEGSKDAVIGVLSPELTAPAFHDLPFDEEAFVDDNPILLDVWRAKDEGADIINKCYPFEEKNRYFEYVFKHVDESKLPKHIREFILNAKSYTATFIAEKNSLLGANSWTEQLFSEENIAVLRRVAHVFEQAYIRFLDLQKAEKQAKEAQIETALERIRSRSLAMHKSDELQEVVNSVFARLKELNVELDTANIIIFTDGSKDMKYWTANIHSHTYASHFLVPYINNACLNDLLLGKESGLELSAHTYAGKEKNELFNYLFEYSDFKNISEDRKHFILESERFTTSVAYIKNIGIQINSYSKAVFSEDENEILKRFTRVFEQAYVRFLDLQKVEAQAREAEIELALERVRAKTMAMQYQNDLRNVTDLLAEQLIHLGFDLDVVNFSNGLNYGDWDFWISAPTSKTTRATEQVTVPWIDHPYFQKVRTGLDNFTKGIDLNVAIFNKEEKDSFLDHLLSSNSLFKNLPDDFRAFLYSKPGFTWSTVFLKETWVSVCKYDTNPFTDEQNVIVRRFANAFGQAYTRFLDLQKAEAQAREAQIEAALERVRSRTMGMQQSSELAEVATVLFQQVKALGVPQWVCGFSIFEIDDKEFTWYPGSPDGDILQPCKVPLTEHPVFISYVESRKRGDELFVYEKEGEYQADHYRYMMSVPGMRKLLQNMLDAGLSIPAFQIDHIANFSHGNLVFITYQHFPEMHDIFKRFAKVFDLTYTRFLDLQKAEAQAREAEIELALERVRAKTMAMQKSDDLQSVVHTVFEKLRELNVDFYTVIIIIFQENSKDIVWWMENKVNQQYRRILVTYSDNPYQRDLFEAKENGTELISKCYFSEEKSELYHHLLEHTDLKQAPEDQKKFLLENEFATMSVAFAKNTAIHITSYSKKSFSETENEILKRFAKVFDQAYTRFLDLQKAEAQAREAQIEAALERVRSRTTGMQKSEELREVIQIVFEQLRQLDFNIDSAHFNLNYKESNDYNLWSAAPGQPYPVKTYIPYFDHPVFIKAKEAKEKGLDFFTESYTQYEKNKFFEHLFKHTPVIPEERRKYILSGEGVAASTVLMNTISLWIMNYAGIPYSEAENAILRRFGKIFEQSHTRFLDLQKAEAQARETQIEASLEKVRSKTMAMHSSSDVAETVATLFGEFVKLGIQTFRCGIGIMHETKEMELWTAKANVNGKADLFTGRMDMTTHPLLQAAYAGWENKDESCIYELKGNDLVNYFNGINNNPKYQLKYDIASLPSRLIHSEFYFAEGTLFAFSLEKLPEETSKIFKRFAAVFGQTYRRYLDLQKAELQAREAMIEASLERVRGKAMAMHTSEDLASAISVFYHELESLSLTPARCGVGILNKESRIAELSTTNTTEKGESIELIGKLKMEKHSVLEGVYENWLLQKEYHPVLRGNQIKEYYQLLRPQVAFPDYPNDVVQYGYFFFFSEGGVYAWTEKEMAEDELKIYRRFTSVLSLTYKRYKDLKEAEARALAAVRQASLDRVRAEIASMRTAEDLQRITPLVWKELTALGVPFFRCGVFIMNAEDKKAHIYLTNPDGSPLAALHLDFESSMTTHNASEHWRMHQVYKEHWEREQFISWVQSLIGQGHITQETYQRGGEPPDSLTLQFIPFKQGMLYIGSADALSDVQIEPAQELAHAFSVAYARYEDFKKLEDAKAQIERTLTELKDAQRQLIQSEKMASLGELTAGIAHEIQNPLNFVNNFSDVNKELIEELKGERQKAEGERNTEIEDEILDDIEQNLEKINYHGKRAEAIVKGMLQHSRTSTGQKEPTDINKLADEYLRLSYHGMRAKDKSFNADIKAELDESLGSINVVPQDVGRVLLNLFNNAFYAVKERQRAESSNLKTDSSDYVPIVTVVTKKISDKIEIIVKDNGNGIPQNIVDKIFQPFFTTKPTGQGTGLGLSLAYDIIKAHGGEIKMETKESKGLSADLSAEALAKSEASAEAGSEFIIVLPA